MPAELKDVLLGAVEAKRGHFAHENFAEGYGRVIIGRLKRRRAITATAVGGGTVVAAGAVVVGASYAPWGGFGMPATQGIVTCTTSNPAPVFKPENPIPENMAYAVVDEATGEAATVGWDGEQALAWDRRGDVWRLAGVDGHAELTFASGTVVVLWPGGDRGVEVQEAPGIIVMPIEDYMQDVDLRWDFTVAIARVPGTGAAWEVTLDGDAIGTITTDADVATFTFSNGDSQTLGVVEPGPKVVTLPGGENLVFTFLGDEPEFVGQAESSASPTVTCVTVTPAPSESASPSASPSSSATVSASPVVSPTASEVAVAAGSPFYCAAEIATEEQGDSDLGITSVTMSPAAEVTAAIDALVENIGDDYWDRPSAAEVLKVTLGTGDAATDPALSGAGSTWPGDPTDLWNVGFIMTDGDGAAFARGLGFVAVRDGVVVGVLPADPNAEGHVYVDGNDPNPSAFFLTPDDAFEACPGVDLGDDWDLYAVGGEMYADETGVIEPPIFAWKKIDPQG